MLLDDLRKAYYLKDKQRRKIIEPLKSKLMYEIMFLVTVSK